MTNGEKPYMTYSRLGGQGDVTQNVAMVGDMAYYRDCTSGDYICDPVEPFKEIDHLEYGMMYDDTICCDDGHRDNILGPYHTHVSIGIAYDNYTFVLVQNFENIYITPQSPSDQTPIMQFADGELTIQGKMMTAQFSPLLYHSNTITIFYDPLPTADEYELHKMDNHYGDGKYVACVLQELQTMYCPGVATLTADTWGYNNTPDYDTFLIKADLHSILDKSGVYTVVLTAEPVNAKENDASWRVYTYSIRYEK
ncbi:MAG TPA: hypothetical protein VHD33_02055 [Legionellaceae bacterium]|nr:hypothetical protein [Legionellaceae bacterium]